MNKIVALLGGLFLFPAFADVVNDVVQPVAQPSSLTSRATAAGRGATRVTPSSRGATNNSARSVNARTSGTSRNATQARTGVQSRETVSRTQTTSPARVAQRTNTVRTATKPISAVTTAHRNVVDNTVRTLSNSGRVSARPTVTAARAAATTKVDNSTVISQMDSTSQLSNQCKKQYMSCMDNYCNVLDENQGRCTCSKNIKNYAKTEAALKEANEALQDVAQQIQYIGLTADEIDTLFSQTEAEIQMQATTDNTQLKNSLDSIRDLIVEVKTGTASSTDTGLSFDLSGLLDFDISNSGFDLGSLFGTTTANTSSISNQRGEQLYKTAAARCKTSVLNTCQNQGVDISVITNAYDMEIDKQCIAYEQSLHEANDKMNATVRNAKTVLQKARLMVAQQKNSYDLRGCVNALDSCMQDEFVCGTDYENCLDPTGKYIVNGEVVEGSTPGLMIAKDATEVGAPLYDLTQGGLYQTWNYESGSKNAWYNDGSLVEYISKTVKNSKPSSTSAVMSEYLLTKIGYIEDGQSYGMCSHILKKCQLYTFTGKNQEAAYIYDNTVVKEYLSRTLTQIKSHQDDIISDYASSCIVDVETCLSKNNYNSNGVGYTNAAINACRSQIITCMSVNGDATANPEPIAMRQWVDMVYSEYSQNCVNSGGTWSNGACACGSGEVPNNSGKCVTKSEMNCTSSGGIWSNGTCSCGKNKELNESTGLCETTINPDEEACKASQGTWSGGKCTCPSGTTLNGSVVCVSDDTPDKPLTPDEPTEPGEPIGPDGSIGSDESIDPGDTSNCIEILLDTDGGTIVYNKIYKEIDIHKVYSDAQCSSSSQITDSSLLKASKSGYVFTGFYDEDDQYCINRKGDLEYSTGCNPAQNGTSWTATYSPECINITLDANDGSADDSIAKKFGESTIYISDCKASKTSYTLPEKSGFDFTGYYTATSDGVQCIDKNGNFVGADKEECNPYEQNTTWYAQYTPKCVTITLNHIDESGNVLSGGKPTTLSYSNNQLYTGSTCDTTSVFNSSVLSGMLSGIAPSGGYTYVNVKNYDKTNVCIDANKNYTQVAECKPTADTTWYIVYSAPDVACVEITLDNNDTLGNSTTIYKKVGDTTTYDFGCKTNKMVMPISNPLMGTFRGYYTAASGGVQCIGATAASAVNNIEVCNPKSDTTWYAQYTSVVLQPEARQ